jgi:hypothetical protein
VQAAIDDEWRAQAAGEEPNLTFLPVGNPATHGVGETGAEPKGLTGAARRRRALADRLFAEMVNPPGGVFNGGDDLVTASALPSAGESAPRTVRWDSASLSNTVVQLLP